MSSETGRFETAAGGNAPNPPPTGATPLVPAVRTLPTNSAPEPRARWARAVDGVEGAPAARIVSPVTVADAARQADVDPPVARLTERTLLGAPPWLSSLALHLAVLLLLGLQMIHRPVDRAAPLLVTLAQADGEQLEEEPLAVATLESPDTQQAWSPTALPPVEDPFAAPPQMEVSLSGAVPQQALEAPVVGLAFDGRQPGSKERLLAAYGGNAKSEAAVLLGLQWLSRQQRPDGSWSLIGPYPEGAGTENTPSATAMAMLAFLGAGHTHQQGKFKKHVAEGLAYLLKLEDAEGNFFREGRQTQWFYAQGQCTIALCELYAMTKDPGLQEPAQRAVDFCVAGQDAAGGWRYGPRAGSDTSVTGWVLMALESAGMAGLVVEQDVLYRVSDFLDTVASENDSRYAYMPQQAATPTMTAEGLLCRQYLGWKRDHPALDAGTEYLVSADNLPSWKDRNAYYWYYATQVLHHLEGERWTRWNDRMRDLLVMHQEKGAKNGGSWNPFTPAPDHWGYQGGRLYVTCLSLYTLEVYYRHLPLYSTRAVAAP